MILQALKEYHDRKLLDPKSDIAPEGFEKRELPYIVVVKPDGEFLNLKSTMENASEKTTFKQFLLPRSKTRTGVKSSKITFLLWDHIGYLFGYPDDDPKSARQHETWVNSLETLPDELKKDKGVRAMLLFYSNNEISALKNHPLWQECTKRQSCYMAFSLMGDIVPIPCRQIVKDYVKTSIAKRNKEAQSKAKVYSYCLVTGEYDEIARIHARTPINKDTKSLVAFQKNSGYDSYGKEQCFNAPVSKSAEFSYTTGLNSLLKSSGQRIKVGDVTMVFWSKEATNLENDAFYFFSEPPKDNPDKNTEYIKALYESIWNGSYVVPDDSTRFYVLGLSPNSARISVRFWQIGTVREIGSRLKKHVNDLAIIHWVKIETALPIKKLLRSISVQGKDANIPPNLSGEVIRAILNDTHYPVTLLNAAIRRNRAEQNVTYPRAALIKAFLNRSIRLNNPKNEKEITMCLDTENTNIGYCLGRLFAVLEKVQSDATPGLNATIRDRFFGAASSTPTTVFGNLMRLLNHHLSKLEKEKHGLFITRKQLIGEIMCSIKDFPPHLNMSEQGRFAIGYYHQMQELWTKKNVNHAD